MLRRGEMRAATPTTVRAATEEWLEGARDGSIRNRSGDQYKPSVIRSYEGALRLRILPDLGGAKLSDVRRRDVQHLVDRLLADGADSSTIRNSITPLRVIFRRAIARGDLAVNPTTGVEMPSPRKRHERIASPEDAVNLLNALPDNDRALWATALYAGLRRGELLALRWQDVSLENRVLRVERSWDVCAGVVPPKSRAGRRTVPIPTTLHKHLIAQKLLNGRSGDDLVFGRTATMPYHPTSIGDRAKKAWDAADTKSSETGSDRVLPRLGLHECRHTFASLMIAAGVNAKALSTYMGHAAIAITLDRYGHLMPGNEAEAAALLDAYLIAQ